MLLQGTCLGSVLWCTPPLSGSEDPGEYHEIFSHIDWHQLSQPTQSTNLSMGHPCGSTGTSSPINRWPQPKGLASTSGPTLPPTSLFITMRKLIPASSPFGCGQRLLQVLCVLPDRRSQRSALVRGEIRKTIAIFLEHRTMRSRFHGVGDSA